LATPPDGTKLSLGKLGRATAVGNSNYTSKTSLNSAGRDSSTGKTKLSDFYIGSVDSTLSGYPYVDEGTNETYTMTFTNENSLFQSRIGGRHQNFTWTGSALFAPQANQDYTSVFEAGAISDATTHTSKSFEENRVTDSDFGSWVNSNTLTSWTSSAATVVTKQTLASQSPSGSNNFAVRFDTQDGHISQSFTVKGNSTYQIRTLASSSNTGEGQIDLEISGAYHQSTVKGICGEQGEWYQVRDDFYTSGSAGTNQTLKLTFTAISASSDHKPLLDTIFFERWEGAHFSDTDVTVSATYHDAGQSDGFNDHATRYNTAITKTVEIQDTYGGLSIACFLPGTLIVMSDGSEKPIEEINVGDEVLSVIIPDLPDEDLGYEVWKEFKSIVDMTTLKNSTATVEHLFFDYMDGYWSINSGFLKVTAEHDFWSFSSEEDIVTVRDMDLGHTAMEMDESGVWRKVNEESTTAPKVEKWEWRTPEELSVGNILLSHKGEFIEITSLEYIEGEVEVVNFDVEPLDIYFAGGVLVHNKGANSEP